MNRKEKARPNPNAGHRKRLKEKFANSSVDGFHDYEIVELLLTFAIPRRDVKPVAKALMRRFNGLVGVLDASEEELREVTGVGENAAVLLGYVSELARAYLKERSGTRRVVSSPGDAADAFFSEFGIGPDSDVLDPTERFCAVYLNTRNEVLGIETLHEGPLGSARIHPRQVLEKAFGHNARSVIFIHHCPQTTPKRTKAGRMLAERLEEAARTIDILVHDHIIVGKDSHVSVRDKGGNE